MEINCIIYLIFCICFLITLPVLWLSRKHKIDTLNVVLLLIGYLFIIFSFIAPIMFSQYYSLIIFDEDTAAIGDTIGGIMSPFIGISGVIMTGIAFYAQYRANEMVRNQFELQKFENQFHEMLRLHKENVNGIEIQKNDSNSVIKGRSVFYEMKKEFTTALYIVKNLIQNIDDIKKVYDIFFWGLNKEASNEIEKMILEEIKKIELFHKNKKNNKFDLLNVISTEQSVLYKSNLSITFLAGYNSHLGHYYRHLFHIVKFVAKQSEKLISEDKKMEYLKILRNQLSNYEQEMLFYNWLCGYGNKWENEENQYFTKYKMIHNLWYFDLYKHKSIKEVLQKLVKSNKNGDLFENGDDIDNFYQIIN